MPLQLIVKGNPSEARVACAYNGITVISATVYPHFKETLINTDDTSETLINTDNTFEQDAQKWFVASCFDDNREPAPIGTLLWYGIGRHGHKGLFHHHCDQCIEDGS